MILSFNDPFIKIYLVGDTILIGTCFIGFGKEFKTFWLLEFQNTIFH